MSDNIHSFNIDGTKFKLSEGALALFTALAEDAGNWSGTPLFGGNVGGSQESKGFLTKLKRAKLLTTQVDGDDRTCSWVYFTDLGKTFAKTLGTEITGIG